ncbi:MAG TPA: EamA family transporter [Solirubrobacteraceae bacterium]
MDALALALVLVAAVAHAGWNLLAKQAGGGVAFVWLYTIVAVVLWAPVAALDAHGVTWAGVGFMAGSGVLHAAYFAALQHAYSIGDLSVVYPLARGTGPVLSVAAAVLVLGERPGPLALAGGLLIVGAVLMLAGGRRAPGRGAAVLTGVFIAAYTVWDAHAVKALDQPPVAYFWGAILVQAALLTPFGLRDRRALRASAVADRWRVIGIAILSPLSYVLVLAALARAPVSLVAPAREGSVVLGAFLGTRVLGEGHATRRIVAAAAIAVGIVGLAIG